VTRGPLVGSDTVRASIIVFGLASSLLCRSAHADTWPSLFAEGGAGIARNSTSSPAAEGTMRLGVSYGAITPLVFVGVGLQVFTHFGHGSEAALVARGARFFDDGADWGLIVDAGVSRGFSEFGGIGALSLAAPYGFQLSTVGTLARPERRSIAVLAGFDVVRLFARVLRDSSTLPPTSSSPGTR
jgi:hypothetical protein